MQQTFTPRPYQAEAVFKLTAAWAAGSHNRLAVVLPTGAGKTVILSHLIATVLSELSGRALVIAHREELIQQAAAKIRAVAPHLKVGIVKAGRNEHRGVDVIVASIQTLAVRKRRAAITGIGLIVVDECHHAAADSYVEVLDHFGAWAGLPVAGFTATMTRTDGGLADVWQDIVYKLDILDLMASGHLVDVRGKRVVVEGLDLDQVKTRGGDLQDGQLGQALEDSGAAQFIADAYAEHAADRPGVVFTPTVATARRMADVFTASGITAAAVWGDMPRDDRSSVLARYEAGAVQVLTNCMVLTEGFDAPWASCAVIARPTKSPGLYVQMVGRVLRPAPGKRDALVLDVLGSSTKHKLASIVNLTGKEVPEPRDDQTLTEAAAVPDVPAAGKALSLGRWEDIDLFHTSPIRWLRTENGLWFIPAGAAFYYLLPSTIPGLFRIRRWSQDKGLQPPPNDRDFPQAEAMRWAEIGARRVEGRALTAKDANWRSRPASPKQLGLARYRRVRVGAGWTAGEVSDALDVAQATAVLDQLLRATAAA
ncbi:DEAD/DEAH box helicase [Kitasatospora aureofaciens]|uniref:DEAD/DEAH box helicase n=1 Tax=Kitasatospora aureofaciens TaxID=1894 RepID=UPI00381CABCB